jgi:hypothetical protein
MVRPERIELPTSWFVAMHSIQLSYGRSLKKLRLWIITEANRLPNLLQAKPRYDTINSIDPIENRRWAVEIKGLAGNYGSGGTHKSG